MEQQTLPNIGWAALVPGSPFLLFEINGKPGHKARHRSRIVIPKECWIYPRDPRAEAFMTRTSAKRIFIQNYPDPDTEAYEKMIREYAGLLMRGRAPTERPVSLVVHSFRAVPVSWSDRDREKALAGNIRPTSRPDWDNYGKITDALNEVAWKDDSQVVDGRSIKVYSDRPALRIEIREMVEPSTLGGKQE